MDNNETVQDAIIQDGLDEAQINIKKGERTRLIYELLMENLDMTYENTFQEVVTALRTAQDAYNKGVKTVERIIKQTQKK